VPTLTETLFRCGECGQRKPRSRFSVANGICLACFDQKYCFCEECGEVLRRRVRGHSYYGPFECVNVYRGQVVCYRCLARLRAPCGQECWPRKASDVSIATYNRIGSKRKYGVEIETAECARHRDLHGHTKFGCKGDCSIPGLEFDSPILYGDEGLDCIAKFLRYAVRHGWDTDEQCGCHTHYDMRGESYEQLCSMAYAYRKTLALWEAFVSPHRRNGVYSCPPEWTCSDFKHCVANCDFNRTITGLDDSAKFTELVDYLECERYEAINLRAHQDHWTFEVRMLEGTCDASVICNWITTHCRFIDAVKDMNFDEIDDLFRAGRRPQFRALSGLIGGDDLAEWLKQRARTNGQPV